MKYEKKLINATKIASGRYAVVVHLSNHSKISGDDVTCNQDHGATIFVGYPPGDVSSVCETRDLESVDCQWDKGRKTHLVGLRATHYDLEGRRCPNDAICPNKKVCKCSQKMPVDVGEKSWTVKAQNPLGAVELTDRADLRKRVFMFAPEEVTASVVNARNASVEWQWSAHKYRKLHLVCQVRLSYNGQTDLRNVSGLGLRSTVLRGLIPKQTYTVEIRCGTKQDFWKWGDWSEPTSFDTRGDVPDALDVWMLVNGKEVNITWKTPLPNQTHGQITDYVVTWGSTTGNGTQSRIVVPHENSTALTLGPGEEYSVSVTARNVNGTSSPSSIIIPWLNLDQVKTLREVVGRSGGFDLSWSDSPAASCGYIVDVCPSFSGCRVEWLRVPANTTKATILSENFKDGVRYNLSLYACTPGAPVLLDRTQHYVRETKIPSKQIQDLRWRQSGWDVEISWSAIPPRNQSALVRGYILYYTDSSALSKNQREVFNISTDNPEANSLWARGLPISSYTFTVKALTSVGEGGDTSLAIVMNPLTDGLIFGVITTLLSAVILLVLFTVLCYRNWECIKHKIYPQIPKPFLNDNWLSPKGAQGPQVLQVDACLYSEVDPEVVPVKRFTEDQKHCALNPKEGRLFLAQTQSPQGYYNQPLKKNTTAPPTGTANMAMPLLGPSAPEVNGMVENLSYNVGTGHSMLLSADYQPSVEIDPRPSRELVTIMSYVSAEQNQFIDYQPQCHIEPGDNSPRSPSCDSTNSLIPHSSSE